jgi:hypothetical protein
MLTIEIISLSVVAIITCVNLEYVFGADGKKSLIINLEVVLATDLVVSSQLFQTLYILW